MSPQRSDQPKFYEYPWRAWRLAVLGPAPLANGVARTGTLRPQAMPAC